MPPQPLLLSLIRVPLLEPRCQCPLIRAVPALRAILRWHALPPTSRTVPNTCTCGQRSTRSQWLGPLLRGSQCTCSDGGYQHHALARFCAKSLLLPPVVVLTQLHVHAPGSTSRAPTIGAAKTRPHEFAWNMGTMAKQQDELVMGKESACTQARARAHTQRAKLDAQRTQVLQAASP